MAYNPFDFFRKNQKIFFAVLTIVVMFMFVLSFGQGDFFSWFPQWLSQQRSYGEVMAKVGGEKVRESDLDAIHRQRVLANQFMSFAAERELAALDQKYREVQSATSKVSEENRMAILLPMLILQQQLQQLQSEADLERVRQSMLQSRSELAALMNKPGVRSEDKEAAETVSKLLRFQMHRFAQAATAGRAGSDSGVYFASMPNRNMKDQMEFVLWLKKADQLGIRFTTEDVKQLVDAEFPDVTREQLTTLAGEVVRDKRLTSDALYEALADEFRVRAAQTAVLGPTEVRFHGGYPAPVPYDYYDFYREETSPTQYTFVSVPVEPFMAKVTGEPTDQELKRIFADAKGIEPDPSSPKAGMREPRKIKVQWAEVTGKEPYYDTLAAERMKKVPDTRMSLVMAMPLAGGVLGNAVAPIAFTDLKYNEYKQTQAAIADLWAQSQSNPGLPRTNPDALAGVIGTVVQADPLVSSRFAFTALADPAAKLADATVARPSTAGVLAGVFGGSFATAGSPLTAPVLLTEAAYSAELERRLITGIQGFVVPTLPGAATAVLDPLAAELSVYAGLPSPLPQPQVQPILDQITKNELRFQVAVEDVREFEKKLAETMKQDDKQAAAKQAEEQVAAFIKERGLKTGSSTDLRDIHTIADDPGLAPLISKSGVGDRLLGMLTNSFRKSVFGRTLFKTVKPNPFDPQARPQLVDAVGLYTPVAYPPTEGNELQLGEANPLMLTWRTQETRAESPREFNDPLVQAKALQIWKRNKARELARKAAEEVLAAAKEAGQNGPVVNLKLQDALAKLKAQFPDPADQNRFRLIDKPEYRVAGLVAGDQNQFLTQGQAPPLQPFSLQQGDDFVYPTPKMNEELLANRDKPVGTGVVLTDLPETTYYAAVVTGKDESSPFVFRETVYRRPARPNFGMMTGDAKDVVEARYALDERKEDRERAVALLKAEFGYSDENPELEKRANDSGA